MLRERQVDACAAASARALLLLLRRLVLQALGLGLGRQRGGLVVKRLALALELLQARLGRLLVDRPVDLRRELGARGLALALGLTCLLRALLALGRCRLPLAAGALGGLLARALGLLVGLLE